MKPNTKRIFTGLLCMGLVIVCLGCIKGFKIFKAIQAHAAFAMPPEAVTSAKVTFSDWEQSFSATGNIAPTQGVTLGAEEPGKVVSVKFESGQMVKQGDVLVELDTSVERADLLGAEADAIRMHKEAQRAENLRNKNAMSVEEAERAQASLRVADAKVGSLKAQIGRKTVTAPFTGRTGIRLVNVGQYLKAGDPIVPLQALESVYVNFSVPQQIAANITKGQALKMAVDTYPGRVFQGTLTTINPEVDQLTRNIDLQATVPNPEELLRPGMFTNVELTIGEKVSYLTIPATSVAYAPYGDSVYVLEQMKDKNGKEYLGARQQIIQLGRTRGDQVAVLKGLKENEEIATSGIFKLRKGAAVAVNNSITPGNSEKPTPADT